MSFPPYRLPEIGSKNFGDGLNDYLWSALGVPSSDTYAFFGIGTILSDHYLSRALQRHSKVICYGSGAGLGSLPKSSHVRNTSFVFLRGPLTAKALGLDVSLAITDPVGIISEKSYLDLLLYEIAKNNTPFIDTKPVGASKIIVAPHYANPATEVIKASCDFNGFRYIDMRSHPLEVIGAIQSSSLVICEAMHAAIVADSLGIPWIPIVRSRSLARQFKWHDWCRSIGVNYMPHTQPYLDLYNFATRRRDSVRKGDVSHRFVKSSVLNSACDSALNIFSAFSSKLAHVSSADRSSVFPAVVRRYSKFLLRVALSKPSLSSESFRAMNSEKIASAVCDRLYF